MTPDANEPQRFGYYDIRSKLSHDGVSTLYRAVHRNTGADVAVRVYRSVDGDEVWLQRLEREARLWRAIDHPNVVRVLDFSGAPPRPFLVLEFVDGVSIERRIEVRGAYHEAAAVGLIAQVCAGLHRVHHNGVVHRDVTPDNVLVSCDGIAKLAGFHLIREIESDRNLTNFGRGLGAPYYMAPEQFRNAQAVDVRADIYSLGATLYAMVMGVVPFDNASPLDCWMMKIRNDFPAPRELNPTVSERVDWAIRRAMRAEPSERPGSCHEFLEDLTGHAG